jgi:hypothetical protein
MFYGIRGAKFSKILSNLLPDMVPAGELGDMVEFDLAVTASETKADRSAISGSAKGGMNIHVVSAAIGGAKDSESRTELHDCRKRRRDVNAILGQTGARKISVKKYMSYEDC